jgi:hypothetical protein
MVHPILSSHEGPAEEHPMIDLVAGSHIPLFTPLFSFKGAKLKVKSMKWR